MAKITMPLLSGQVRGKLGDIVFLRRGGQNLARVRTSPAQPRTEKQITVRHNMGALANVYKGVDATVRRVESLSPFNYSEISVTGLSATERASWKSHAEFIGYNSKRLWNNQALIRIKP